MLAPDVLDLPGLHLLGHRSSIMATMPMELHTHKNALEFVVAFKGNECYFVEGNMYSISRGDVFISFADQPHSNGGVPQGISEFIWFQIDPGANNLLGLSADRAECLRGLLASLGSHLLKADKECLFLLKKSLDCFMNFDESSRQYAQCLFAGFLFRLLTLHQIRSTRDVLIDKAMQYIENAQHSSLTLEELSGLCGISLSGFKHRFKEYTGKTPRDYINQCKINKAKELLRKGKSVTEAAMDLGFSSSEYFAVVFRKYTMLTPGEYKNTLV